MPMVSGRKDISLVLFVCYHRIGQLALVRARIAD